MTTVYSVGEALRLKARRHLVNAQIVSENIARGKHCYLIGGETRDWFHRQWLAWPERAAERRGFERARGMAAQVYYENKDKLPSHIGDAILAMEMNDG